ncbi:response regulator transcription factor [Marinimicrobium sp. ABcell2]|uniref:response regulator transcription factor n=1 Tax=Marinimicrobium sp. ABcell2 TaxID=3069751 RepID=UPI0027B36D8A|nr:response regulator [Marinimicrobium sp. ABcell2]MDQ2076793.1 response regulator [Marinimicrobium sp. ABcell2]
MASILWVEDQSHWVDRFKPILEETVFDQKPTDVHLFRFAEAACQHIRLAKQAPDLALLDAHMNGNDEAGFSVSRALQKKWPDVPILYLSEHSGTGIEQQAFETTGAVDFIAKHQRNIESVLCWRIRAALRQSALSRPGSQAVGDVLHSGDLTLDTVSWEVYWKGQKLMNPANHKRPLAPTPRKILRYLVEAAPQPLNTTQIAGHLDADPERFSYANYRQHIRTLRLSFDQAMGGSGEFLELCRNGTGIVTFGDEGAYFWKPNR